MAFVRKTWKDRISQYPNRRTITDENGVTKPVTVGRDEGEVTQEGDGFTATNMNNLEQRIYSAFQQGGGGGGGGGSAADTTFDDTDVAFTADNVQTALEVITKSLTWAEYQSLTTEEKNNGTIYLITDVNGDLQNFQPVIYSEQEREIGVWTDGRPVYEKTLNIGEIASNINLKSFAHGIENLDWIIDYSLFALYANETKMISPATGSNYTYGMVLNKWDNTNIYISKGNLSYGFTNTYCVIRYTKSTDTAGSGTWTPQGVPAVHYSENEQIVGSWIDESTIYEKTLHVQPTGNVNDYTTFASISGINVVLSMQFFAKRNAAGIIYYYTGNGTTNPEVAYATQFKLGTRISNENVQYYVSGYGTEITDIYVTVRYTKSSS